MLIILHLYFFVFSIQCQIDSLPTHQLRRPPFNSCQMQNFVIFYFKICSHKYRQIFFSAPFAGIPVYSSKDLEIGPNLILTQFLTQSTLILPAILQLTILHLIHLPGSKSFKCNRARGRGGGGVVLYQHTIKLMTGFGF